MQKSISTQGLEASVGEVVDAVRLRGDQYIIERDGEPVAAMVPMHVLRTLERERKRLFERIAAVAARNAGKSDEDIERVIDEEVVAVRAERRQRLQGR